MSMNWDTIKGKWTEYKGQVRTKWGKLTDDDLNVISGKREVLLGKLESRYGFAKEAAEKEVNAFLATMAAPPPVTPKVDSVHRK
jgi:uncharacterized protein YjbJ (UPF0337 family)